MQKLTVATSSNDYTLKMESRCIKVPKREGEKARKKLIELGAIDKNLKIKAQGEYLLIPVTVEIKGEIEIADFEELKKEKSIVEELGFSPAYEVIGDIAIIYQHQSNAERVAEALIHKKKIKTVLQAASAVKGEYRTRDYTYLAGERRTETLYRENKCRYLLDVAKVYFTPRLATERMRIANEIKNGDKVVDMFAGVGPFSILIAKKNPDSHITAIDKNPVAIKYLRENMRLNRVKNIDVREGDIREQGRGILNADHVIMNLPQSGFDFLDIAFNIIKKGGMIHFYAIAHKDEFEGIWKKIEESANRFDLRLMPLEKRIVKPYAPYQYNICIDFKVG